MYPLVPTDDLLPWVIEGLKAIPSEYLLFIVSNQSFIARGRISETEVLGVFQTLMFKFRQNGIFIQECVYCPHESKQNCNCRKPNTALVDDLVKRYNLDLKNSLVVGDAKGDFELALNLGCHFVGVKNPHTTDAPDWNDPRITHTLEDMRKLERILGKIENVDNNKI